MAYIPSQRVAEALALAGVGLWIEALHDRRIAIVAKMPETVIKALHRGATASFFVGVMPGDWLRFLCLGLRVNDEPSHPFTLTMPNTSPQDSVLLRNILCAGSATLHCINELDHPVLSAWCKLDPSASRNAGEALESSDHWLLTLDSSNEISAPELARNMGLAQDNFESWIFGPRVQSLKAPRPALPIEIPLALDFWPRQTVILSSPTLQETFAIDDEAEGEKLERAVLSVVELLFPERAYRSPRIPEGSGTRELTDVLGFNDRWMCVI